MVNDPGTKTLAATLQVNSNAILDKVTILQVHGITGDGSNAPPLLRVAGCYPQAHAGVVTVAFGHLSANIKHCPPKEIVIDIENVIDEAGGAPIDYQLQQRRSCHFSS